MKHPINIQLRAIMAILLGLSFSGSALAHPHSWIDTKTQILGNNKTLDGFKMEWTFDRMTTAYLFDGEDMSPHHQQQTLKAIAKSIINNMSPSHNFTYLDEAKHSLDYQKVSDETLRVEKGKAILDFTLLLDKPYQFHGKSLALRIFDPTYYVDMSWDSASDVQFSKGLEGNCSSSLIEPHPTVAQVNKAMTLPVDASPDYQLGKVFTQTLNFSCHYEDK
ncbi:exported protein precursor [Vibrio sp. JCM 19236]|nr:exported protein precursor [Vibrio sp. JCM 19236]